MTEDQRKVHILAIDDSEEDCRLNRLILEGAGYTVDTAATAREARAKIAAGRFGVLLVDLRLPDANGLELLADAKKRDPHIVTIVLTGYGSTDNAVRALKAGAYDFLMKPCPHEKLVSAIRRAAERYQLTRTLAHRNKELETVNQELDRRVRDATSEIFALNEKLTRNVRHYAEAHKVQSRALEEVAHELKNPLAVIWGYSSLWLERPLEEWSSPDHKRCLENIHRNAKNLQVLIDDLLDSSRLMSRKIILEKERFPAQESVLEAVEELQLRAEKAGIKLRAECRVKPQAYVLADRGRMRQIIVNLVTNAIKFTPQGGRIIVRSYAEGEFTHLEVADTGKGIEPEQLKNVFERFFQIKDPETSNPGLGLGLSIVKGLVELHGGKIWAESAPGAGASFHVLLPSRPDAKRPLAPTPIPSHNPRSN